MRLPLIYVRCLVAAQEAQTYRQVTIDQEWSTHSPLFSWDNTYPGVELLLSRLDPSDSSHAAAVRGACTDIAPRDRKRHHWRHIPVWASYLAWTNIVQHHHSPLRQDSVRKAGPSSSPFKPMSPQVLMQPDAA